MPKREKKSWFTKIGKKINKTLQNVRKKIPRAPKEVGKSLSEGIQVSVVRGKDDKRTKIDESKEGPVQGFYIGARSDETPSAEGTEVAEVAPTKTKEDYVWWRDLRFAIPTGIGLASILVSIILWLAERALY